MKDLKVVIDSSYINYDFSFNMEVDEDEYLEAVNDLDSKDEIESVLFDKFGDEAWDVIRNNLEWHIEVEEEDE